MNETRAPTDMDLRENIRKDYLKGTKPKALHEKYGISINTIKSWIKRGNWGKEESAPRLKENASQKRARGAPIGNKNAAGHGAPVGNHNAFKHGAYAAVYLDVLDDEEKLLLQDMSDNEDQLLVEQIAIFSLRERRILKAINEYRSKGEQYISGAMRIEDKRIFSCKADELLYMDKINKKVKNGERLPGNAFNQTTNTSATIDLLTRLERELTAVQGKKTKAIDSLAKLRLEKQKIAGESKGNEAVRLWAEKVKRLRGDQLE